MYRIVKDGTSLGITEAPTYVRQAENGCFVLCQEAEATGIAYNGTAYHLLGREDMGGRGERDPGGNRRRSSHNRGQGPGR